MLVQQNRLAVYFANDCNNLVIPLRLIRYLSLFHCQRRKDDGGLQRFKFNLLRTCLSRTYLS
jgi:hypothetical protein